MRHRPYLSDDRVAALLEESYGLELTGLTFLPVGEDGWAFRAEAVDGRAWFVKLNQQPPVASLSLIDHLCRSVGLDWIPAPRPAADGSLWVEWEGLYGSMQPYIEGRNLMERPIEPGEARDIGNMLVDLHAAGAGLPDELRTLLPVENYSRHQDTAALVLTAEGTLAETGSVQYELARFIRGKRLVIDQVLARVRSLGERIRERKPANVLCHADIHAANMIADPAGKFWVIDWDGIMLAPCERDLFFWHDSDLWPSVSAGYGLAGSLDDELLRYYVYEWVVQEIADFGENVFFLPLSEEQKQDSFAEFVALFEPGNVVESALNY